MNASDARQQQIALLKRLIHIHTSHLDASGVFREMLEILMDDIVKIGASLPAAGPETDRNRRSFVRAVFAAFEGVTFAIKQMAPSRAAHFPHAFSRGETALLYEESYSPSRSPVGNRCAKHCALATV